MKKSFVYGSAIIEYDIAFSNRKTMTIKVMPSSDVIVTAPYDTDLIQLEARLHRRAHWILKQQQYFKSFGERMPEKRYVSGESHYYLGRQYLLRVTEGKANSAKYKGRFFEVECSPKSKAKELMKEWYRERAKVKLLEIVNSVAVQFERYGVSYSGFYIQEMENRWGSCTAKGKIILNTELIKAPKACIKYVVVHELCHLIHHNHTKEFYELLEKEMPDWKRWKDKLELFMY